MIRKIVKALASGDLSAQVFRKVLRSASNVAPIPFSLLVETGSLERAPHAYCMWHAARLAKELKYPEISVAEFGVAGGNTLAMIEGYARDIEEALGVKIKVYGFDTGSGLPSVEDFRDLPYWFKPNQYAMDVAKLRARLKTAELILGNVKDTVGNFFITADRPPLGAIFNDLDFFSSSRDALHILDADSRNFLPRVFMYLDDVVGTDKEMYGPFNGELAAIEEFNHTHDKIKIHLNQNLLPIPSVSWKTQIYYIHLFDHPLYNNYVGGSDQTTIESIVKLNR
jgi:hypothetical protein